MQNIVAIEYAIDESDHLYIVMPREIVLWDLSIGQPLASIRLDRTDHDFTTMAQSLALPATVLATHKDGCLSCWQRCSSDAATNAEGGGGAAPGSPLNPLPGSPSMPRTRIYFQFRSMVPLLKGGGSSLVSFAPSKPSGTRFGGVSADGRVWLWTLLSPLTGTAVGRPPSRVPPRQPGRPSWRGGCEERRRSNRAAPCHRNHIDELAAPIRALGKRS